MAGRIRDEDVALVRERASIDDVVREYVTLKTAGGGSLKGLCPFHDEKSPSFHVTPSRGMWYCFGCGEGGDVINFVQRMDHLSFAETIEKLAEKTGVQLRYVDGGAAINRQQGVRTRLWRPTRRRPPLPRTTSHPLPQPGANSGNPAGSTPAAPSTSESGSLQRPGTPDRS